MNYRRQALILGSLLMIGGIAVLGYVADLTLTTSSLFGENLVGGSIAAFMGLGLVLIGTLTMFAAPETLVASEIANKALSPAAENLILIIESLKTTSRAIHVPKVILGRESEVFLVISEDGQLAISESEGAEQTGEMSWSRTRKVLQPTGIALMQAYEKVLKRDFLGLEVSQLARLLGRAIVPELQLGAGFSLRELSSERLEATWTKPTVSHTCIRGNDNRLPELCCLCSSVACALAKATGRPVWVEVSTAADTSLAVTTTYRVLGE